MALTKTILNGHEVEYDDNEFEVRYSVNNDYLHYIGDGINVTNPKGNTSCYCMFQDYKGTSIDLSKFDTHSITNMSCMFANCSNLSYLNLSNFDTGNVRDISFMFNNCCNLKSLNLSSFNTHNVIDMSYMFHACMNLKTLDTSSFYIGNTKMLDNKFWDCKSLETLKVSYDCLQFFLDHKKFMFGSCGNINIIPISKLDRAVNDLFY